MGWAANTSIMQSRQWIGSRTEQPRRHGRIERHISAYKSWKLELRKKAYTVVSAEKVMSGQTATISASSVESLATSQRLVRILSSDSVSRSGEGGDYFAAQLSST